MFSAPAFRPEWDQRFHPSRTDRAARRVSGSGAAGSEASVVESRDDCNERESAEIKAKWLEA